MHGLFFSGIFYVCTFYLELFTCTHSFYRYPIHLQTPPKIPSLPVFLYSPVIRCQCLSFVLTILALYKFACIFMYMEYEVQGHRPRGRPNRTWTEVVEKDCQACKLIKEDAMDDSKWRKLIKDVWWSGWVWVDECFFWYQPTRVVPDKRPLNGCVCECCSSCRFQPYDCIIIRFVE